MTQSPGGLAPPQNSQSTPEVARDEAAEVARTAASAGSDVAETVGDQAKRVTAETGRQARDLLDEGRTQLTEQARDAQNKAATGLHTLADQLDKMSQSSDGGVAPEMAQQVADRTRTVASWLEHHEPGDLVTQVRTFARRKPGVFLAGAVVAGVLAGRLTRGVVASQSDSESDTPSGNGMATRSPVPAPGYTSQTPVDPATPGYVMPPSGTITPPGTVTR
jgi:hypothetical protein